MHHPVSTRRNSTHQPSALSSMPLASRYAPQGISKENEHKITVSGRHREKKPVNFTVRNPEVAHDAQNSIDNEDIEMAPIDTMDKAEDIMNYITESRNSDSINPVTDDMELDKFYTQTVPVHLEGNVSYLIVDTNFLLSHLTTLDQLKSLGTTYFLRIVIPIAVIHELDGLKNGDKHTHRESNVSDQSVARLARKANDWIYAALSDPTSTVMGQNSKQRINKLAVKDDAILDCCLYFQKEYPHTLQVLLSNDKNLCMKALLNKVLTVSHRKNMDARLISEMILTENIHRFGEIAKNTPVTKEVEIRISQSQSSVANAYEVIIREILTLVISVVRHCMESEFGDDLDLLRNYDSKKMVSLSDATNVILEFWLPVFSSYLRQFKQFSIRHHAEAKEMCIFPADKHSLDTFLEFWTGVLRVLYDRTMDQEQRNSLEMLIQRWHELSESI